MAIFTVPGSDNLRKRAKLTLPRCLLEGWVILLKRLQPESSCLTFPEGLWFAPWTRPYCRWKEREVKNNMNVEASVKSEEILRAITEVSIPSNEQAVWEKFEAFQIIFEQLFSTRLSCFDVKKSAFKVQKSSVVKQEIKINCRCFQNIRYHRNVVTKSEK